jgi:hydroxyacylglutathione hydrolase
MSIFIERLPAFDTNYIFLLYDRASQTAAVVDPGEVEPVQQRLKALGATLTAIFNTHHHWDHTGANMALLDQYPEAIVYGGEGDRGRIPGQQVFLKEGDGVSFGGYPGTVLFVPGHTHAHIAYYFPKADWPTVQSLGTEVLGTEVLGIGGETRENPTAILGTHGDLFCGDTLFAGGCGRLFEGTPAQMLSSLDRFRQLPEDTRVWCAHEYTLNNLKFALTIEPDNLALQARYGEVTAQRQRGEATIPSTLAIEKQTNPFLRWDQAAVQAALGSSDSVTVFTGLRGKKDLF